MEKVISCCGVICSDCESFPDVCAGCPIIKGKAPWLVYTDESVCGIYDCCIQQNSFSNCGLCKSFPCSQYTEAIDPTKSEQENDEILKSQIEVINSLNND
ncbi:DUF3795 domain-containing protein [Breznakia pachnodae]|uniref:DUF3795 domain-containing protein n=1 Tax=Breznakia pachnodae TaxID=265178 RepID=A0ABU0E5G0_9FIRM|nr:DUF3795 domain-containing protein [Breznakia pachnodae]MDQ0362132.1 hypothetical protein [Breznakia pachnodae]